MNVELRYQETECRLFNGPNGRVLRGTIKYDVLSQDLGGFKETIAPGAFRRSLASGREVQAFYNHHIDGYPLGDTTSGTLRLTDGEFGLDYEIDLPDTTDGRDLIASMNHGKGGTVRGVSFGFISNRENWSEGGQRRRILDADFDHVSPTPNPAYIDNTIALRSLDAWRRENEPQPVIEVAPDPDRLRLLDLLERTTR